MTDFSAIPPWATAVPSTPLVHPQQLTNPLTRPLTDQQLLAFGEQIIEQFLRRVVLALTHMFIPNASAFEQLQQWADNLFGWLRLNELLACISNSVGQLLSINWLDPQAIWHAVGVAWTFWKCIGTWFVHALESLVNVDLAEHLTFLKDLWALFAFSELQTCWNTFYTAWTAIDWSNPGAAIHTAWMRLVDFVGCAMLWLQTVIHNILGVELPSFLAISQLKACWSTFTTTWAGINFATPAGWWTAFCSVVTLAQCLSHWVMTVVKNLTGIDFESLAAVFAFDTLMNCFRTCATTLASINWSVEPDGLMAAIGAVITLSKCVGNWLLTVIHNLVSWESDIVHAMFSSFETFVGNMIRYFFGPTGYAAWRAAIEALAGTGSTILDAIKVLFSGNPAKFILGMIGLLFGTAGVTAWNTFLSAISGGSLTTALGAISGLVTDIFSKFPAGTVISDLAALLHGLLGLLGTSGDVVAFFQEAINTFWGIVNAATGSGKTIQDIIDSLPNWIPNLIASIVSAITRAIGDAIGTPANALTTLTNWRLQIEADIKKGSDDLTALIRKLATDPLSLLGPIPTVPINHSGSPFTDFIGDLEHVFGGGSSSTATIVQRTYYPITIYDFGGTGTGLSGIFPASWATGVDTSVFTIKSMAYPATLYPMGNSIQAGVDSAVEAILATPGGFIISGISQGAAVVSKLWINEISSSAGRLYARAADCLALICFGNPLREAGTTFPGCPDPGGHGIASSAERLIGTPTKFWNFANPGDDIAVVFDDTNGALLTEIWDVIQNSWFGLAEGVAHLIASPPSNILDLLREIPSLLQSLGGPHQNYNVTTPLSGSGDHRTCYQIGQDYISSLASHQTSYPVAGADTTAASAIVNAATVVTNTGTAQDTANASVNGILNATSWTSTGSPLTDVENALNNIPHPNVIGLGTTGAEDIGSSIQNFLDGLWQGLTGQAGTGKSTSDVANAAGILRAMIHGATITEITTSGSVSIDTTGWASGTIINVICLGGGGGASGSAGGNTGIGGSPGTWSNTRLVFGTDVTGSSFTVNATIGGGGAGGAGAFTSSPGSAGGTTTAIIASSTTSASGGAGGSGTSSSGTAYIGGSPGTYTDDTMPYNGGNQQTHGGAAGCGPGGGGAGGINPFAANGGAGAPGAVWITQQAT